MTPDAATDIRSFHIDVPQEQIDDLRNPPDWYPDQHAPPPLRR
jgi:hypothetical protein